jgi:hypothetical protein
VKFCLAAGHGGGTSLLLWCGYDHAGPHQRSLGKESPARSILHRLVHVAQESRSTEDDWKNQDNFHRIESLIERKNVVRSIAVVGHESRKNSWTWLITKERPTMLTLCAVQVSTGDSSFRRRWASQRNQRECWRTGHPV